MTSFDALKKASAGLDTRELLRFLVTERFPGKAVVTASLRSSSITVLKMLADIDPATPVIFCRRGATFPESLQYHETIVGLLGLSNVQVSQGHEPSAKRGDYDHCEQMWIEYQNAPGRSFEIAHLNDILAPYECWISAVYHVVEPAAERKRVDIEGRLVRVDPLADWSRQDVRDFMRANELPFHERAYRSRTPLSPWTDTQPIETYNV
jgi:phosphoadenosine phosphosulfate reductase